MKQTYLVGVREVHVRHYRVEAESEAQAKDLVKARGPEVIDCEFEEGLCSAEHKNSYAQ